MSYGYGYDTVGSSFSSGFGSLVWIIIAFILSLVGCFVIYFLFVRKNKEETNKTLAWLKEFLRFDKMLIETILKIAYIFAALFITLGSFAIIGSSFVSFLLVLIVGNLVNRIIYELSMITIMIWKNTSEIRNRLK